ncbi:translin [Tripterygium wilfordii]|uniref:Translin n=1 Tax=Tripterygium wilfordii TaxID=458696 RepID=A0A7J7DNF4_TRIWF|nr:translin [Tripterygium wilfordii]
MEGFERRLYAINEEIFRGELLLIWPRYVVNQVTAGDYDCPGKVFSEWDFASLLLEGLETFILHFTGMKYDLRRVEEVYYDVKIKRLGCEWGIQLEIKEFRFNHRMQSWMLLIDIIIITKLFLVGIIEPGYYILRRKRFGYHGSGPSVSCCCYG